MFWRKYDDLLVDSYICVNVERLQRCKTSRKRDETKLQITQFSKNYKQNKWCIKVCKLRLERIL
jgi:hypothetical protein